MVVINTFGGHQHISRRPPRGMMSVATAGIPNPTQAKHKVEVKDARWYVRKAGDGARKVAGWCQAKAQAVVSVHWGEWLREALRKKSAQEKEAKRTKNLETRAETDKCGPICVCLHVLCVWCGVCGVFLRLHMCVFV